ncbi:MAG: L-rhamnose/proton symporter RhaT [Planctomycetes bacterium]|jgi:L-rhamnose-H+ transport protein|nr:L-rhamnose/proton symporter RhaT [Planctomycetota bacterium]
MTANPVLGVVFHWIGGLASASFYVPYRKVHHWSWETYWLVGGFFSWIIAPLVFASLLVPDFWHALLSPKTERVPFFGHPLTLSNGGILFLTYLFGALWGLGGLTFGLTMRYLGIGLGMAIALSYCAAFGTLMPPLFNGSIIHIAQTMSGQVILLGVLVCLLGIAVSGVAGMAKERELPEERKKATVKEFNFSKGLLVATFSGVMSACFAYGLAAGTPINQVAQQILQRHHRAVFWDGLPALIVVLLGGFTTNFIWCAILHLRHHNVHEYLALTSTPDKNHIVTVVDGPEYSEPPEAMSRKSRRAGMAVAARPIRVPLLINYAFCALAGTLWYLQFFFYTMGQTQMGPYKFSGWTLHMASIIIFATLWGVALHEWKGTSKRTHLIIGAGLAVLIGSTAIIGYGNYLKIIQKPVTVVVNR